MKVHIITIHHITNFGSVFQATALCQAVNEYGFSTDIIDYRPAYYDEGRNKLRTIVGKIINYKSFCTRRKKYDAFIRDYEKLSNIRFYNAIDLKSIDEEGDLFIAGGDQLWNSHHPCGRDDSYKLGFVNKGKKIAFGTSIGRNNLSDSEWNELSKSTEKFDFIGLREQSTVNLLREYTNIRVEHVLDPVMLYDGNYYKEKYITDRPIKKKFAVLYLIKSSELLNNVVDWLRGKGFYIIQVSGFTSKSRVDMILKDSGPCEILNYIYHADFVLSGSFHASLFSIIFNKQFATLLPEENTNARIENLVELTGLENRIVHDDSEICRIDELIDYKNVNQIIERKRIESRRLLRQMLKKELR